MKPDAGDLGPPLLILLLPQPLERFPLREPVEQLLAAPGALAIEPAGGTALDGWPIATVPSRGARPSACSCPGTRARSRVFDAHQLPLAVALVERHPDAELWAARPARLPRHRRSRFDLGAAGRPAPGLGADGGARDRVGPARLRARALTPAAARCRGARASTAPTASSVQVTGSSRNAAYIHVCTTTATKPAATNARYGSPRAPPSSRAAPRRAARGRRASPISPCSAATVSGIVCEAETASLRAPKPCARYSSANEPEPQPAQRPVRAPARRRRGSARSGRTSRRRATSRCRGRAAARTGTRARPRARSPPPRRRRAATFAQREAQRREHEQSPPAARRSSTARASAAGRPTARRAPRSASPTVRGRRSHSSTAASPSITSARKRP